MKIFRSFSSAIPSTKQSKVRVRFAPSPTGSLHLGGLRTALYNYLFAKKNKGQFILRIEDTDRKRYVPGSVENLVQNLSYFKLQWDEGPGATGADGQMNDISDYQNQGPYGPYFQSMRLPIYQKYVKELLQNGDAYMCFCDADRLEKLKIEQTEKKIPPKYDGHCRNLTNEQIRMKILNGEKYTIRLKVPDGETSFQDIIHGQIKISHDQVDDQVLIKSDGFPTYHLANVIDDYTMKISHVIRGHEWITSTPKHLILYDALNLKPPKFAHIPLLVKKGGAKLSKRDQSSSVDFYRENQYLPEAVDNFVALLGWYPKYLDEKQELQDNFSAKEEVFDLAEIAALFTLERISGSNSQVDEKKLLFFNGQHLKKKFADIAIDKELLEEFKGKIIENIGITKTQVNLNKWSHEDQLLICEMIRERINAYSDIKQQFSFLFEQPKFDSESAQKSITKNIKNAEQSTKVIEHFKEVFAILSAESRFTQAAINQAFSEYLFMHQEIKNEGVFHLIRIALTGTHSGPSTGTICYILGAKTSIERMEYFEKNILNKILKATAINPSNTEQTQTSSTEETHKDKTTSS